MQIWRTTTSAPTDPISTKSTICIPRISYCAPEKFLFIVNMSNLYFRKSRWLCKNFLELILNWKWHVERKIYVQDLQQHHIEFVKKYHHAIDKLVNQQDDTTFINSIISNDLAIRDILNPIWNYIHSRWDDIFIIIPSSNNNIY